MVLRDPSSDMRYPDYGIGIPVLDSRADRVLAALDGRLPVVEGLGGAARLLGEDEDGLRMGRADLERVHSAAFVDRLFGSGLEAEILKAYELVDADGAYRRYDPASASRPLADLFSTVLEQASLTYAACRIALARGGEGFCFYLGGGMHHARRDEGAGFCLVNDVMAAAARLVAEGRAGLAWIIDVDAHKGDGTAEIARGRADVLALSIHMADGWPLDHSTLKHARRRGVGADRAPFASSAVDVGVPRGGESWYVRDLEAGMAELERLSAGRRADLAVVVDGADPYEHDGLPSSEPLRLSLGRCVERDEAVLGFLRERGVPSAWVMAGGYGERAWEPPAAFLSSVAGSTGAA